MGLREKVSPQLLIKGCRQIQREGSGGEREFHLKKPNAVRLKNQIDFL